MARGQLLRVHPHLVKLLTHVKSLVCHKARGLCKPLLPALLIRRKLEIKPCTQSLFTQYSPHNNEALFIIPCALGSMFINQTGPLFLTTCCITNKPALNIYINLNKLIKHIPKCEPITIQAEYLLKFFIL